MPPEFEQGAHPWLPANLGRDYYRKQADTHIASLAQKISNVQRQIEEQAGGLLDERDRLIGSASGSRTNSTTLGLGWRTSSTTSPGPAAQGVDYWPSLTREEWVALTRDLIATTIAEMAVPRRRRAAVVEEYFIKGVLL